MITLILGKNNSGKSSYAESIIANLSPNKRYYIATMIPYGDEGIKRVNKHLKMRESLNMITIEDPFLTHTFEIDSDSDVLLEDISNLLANRMFEKGNLGCESIVDDIILLSKKTRNLVLVSISDIVNEGYDEETVSYINQLNIINKELEKLADKTIKMGEL